MLTTTQPPADLSHITTRVFLAHPKGRDPTPEEQAKLRALFAKFGAPNAMDPTRLVFVSGSTDYQQNFARCGGWEGWGRSVATGTFYVGHTQQPRYDLFVVLPDQSIGKATADIIRAALAVKKPVFYFDGDRVLAQVSTVAMTSGEFKGGWRVY